MHALWLTDHLHSYFVLCNFKCKLQAVLYCIVDVASIIDSHLMYFTLLIWDFPASHHHDSLFSILIPQTINKDKDKDAARFGSGIRSIRTRFMGLLSCPPNIFQFPIMSMRCEFPMLICDLTLTTHATHHLYLHFIDCSGIQNSGSESEILTISAFRYDT